MFGLCNLVKCKGIDMSEDKYIYKIDQVNSEWIYIIFEIVDNDWIPISTIVNPVFNKGISFGKRRDVFNRLVDLRLMEKSKNIKDGQSVKLTEIGRNLKKVFSLNKLKGIQYLHAFHIIESFKHNTKRYLTTYRFATEIFYENKSLKHEHFPVLVKKLEDYFNVSTEGIIGMDKSTISKSTVFAKEIICNENRNIDLKLASYCIQEYLVAKTGNQNGQILLSDDALKDMSILFLVDKREVTILIDRIIKMIGSFQKRHAIAGSYLMLVKQNDIC